MAAAQLDRNWDTWTARLTEGYAQTLLLLEEDQPDEAIQQYRTGVAFTVKQLFSEAADVYPLRFEGAVCWSDWTRQLYRLTIRTEQAFAAGKLEEAVVLLTELRRHFYELHRQCNSVKRSNALFAVMDVMNMEDAGAQAIAEAVELLLRADSSQEAEEEDDAYQQARDHWLAQVRPALAHTPFTDNDRLVMRQATAPFYKAYGLRFE